MKNIILKFALENAFHYGSAELKPVMARVFAEMPEQKKNAKLVVETSKTVIKQVNELNEDEVRRQLEEIAPELIEQKRAKEEKELPPLKNAVSGKVRTRLPPEPSGFLHIGHALSFSMSYLYAQKYSGQTIMKFEDTNPFKADTKFYDAILKDIKWLGISWDELFITSEHFGELEKKAEELIHKRLAYVCECEPDAIKQGRGELKPDPCRKKGKKENLIQWDEMRNGDKLILRWKGDPAASNSVLRDPTLYRVLDKVHPWTGKNQVIYPTYDFASAVADGLLGITHVLRSEEFLMRAELHKQMIGSLGLPVPEYIHYGRFELEGSPTSKRKIRALIDDKIIAGWDDVRLASLAGLRRHGVVPQTFQDLVVATGPYLGSSTIAPELLFGLNRKNIDPIAERYFAVREPVKLKLDGEKRTVKINKHPTKPEMGTRSLKAGDHIIIEKQDYSENKQRLVRLKGLYNVKLGKNKASYVGEEIIRPIIQWLSESDKAELVIADKLFDGDELSKNSLKTEKILVETGLKNSGSDIVQLERYGFVRIDSRKPLRLVFISK
ncbi:MAG: glutamate--tRNA ligase [Candidatus Altiarchaeota archaeon]|nr:glutamate--tRNA ligase [Candidatus Altiarchaeota archaeon]